MKAENVMESLMTLINKMNTRDRDAQKKEKRAAQKTVESEEIDEIEPEALQYNLLNGGLDRMPAGRAASQQTVTKRRFGEPPKPMRAIGA